MPEFLVYLYEKTNGSREYKAFDQDFLGDPYVTGNSIFLPCLLKGRRYYQKIVASSDIEAVEQAKRLPKDRWQWRISDNFDNPLTETDILPYL